MAMLPFLISALVQAHVSLVRLRDFLLLDEVGSVLLPECTLNSCQMDPDSIDKFECNEAKGCLLSVKNGVFSWDTESEPFLQDINVDVESASLVAIVGPVCVTAGTFI